MSGECWGWRGAMLLLLICVIRCDRSGGCVVVIGVGREGGG